MPSAPIPPSPFDSLTVYSHSSGKARKNTLPPPTKDEQNMTGVLVNLSETPAVTGGAGGFLQERAARLPIFGFSGLFASFQPGFFRFLLDFDV